MSIRLRLVMSYLIMLAVPLLLLGTAILVILSAFVDNFGSLYKLDQYEGNPVAAILQTKETMMSEIRSYGSNDPEELLRPGVQQDLDKRLKVINMGLIILSEEQPVFVSPSLQDDQEPERLSNLLTHLKSSNLNIQMENYDGWLVLERDALGFDDHMSGQIFIVMNVYNLGYFVGDFFHSSMQWLLFGLLAVFVLTNGLLTYYVSRSILRPLRALKLATEEIKLGNLDSPVSAQSRDELGELSLSFEEMRLKLKRSVERQLAYEENRKELISHISHDLKTPITSILGYVEGIVEGVADTPDKMDQYLKTISVKTLQMDRLIDELFLLSKLDLGEQAFHFESLEVVALLDECLEGLLLDMERQGIVCSLSYSESLRFLKIRGDRNKLKRAVTNVLENAAKYMDKEKGRLVIKLANAGQRLLVQIEDNGPGIQPHELPHIFERFYRVEPSRNLNLGGSGLGLAIVKEIVEQHGGRVEARSIPGRGTSIYFTLPKAGSIIEKGGADLT